MLRRLGASLCAAVVVVALSSMPAVSDTTTPVPFPKYPKGIKAPVTLPTALDPPSSYQPQVSCNPVNMVGPTKLRTLVLASYKVGRPGNISRGCTEGISEHSEGRAWDWMLNDSNAKEKAVAGDFLAWVTANHGKNARRLGIMYVIHNKKIWSIYRESEGWRPNTGHTDHIHISFSWNGARANTSFWTGKVQPVDYGRCAAFAGQPATLTGTPRLTPCPKPAALVKKSGNATRMYGSRTSTVSTAQSLLKITKTGLFDAKTWSAVKAYQSKHDLPRTGELDNPTWSSLKPWGITSDSATGYTRLTAAAYGLANYSATTIGWTSVGKPVEFLQVALGMAPAYRNGYFAAATKAAVLAFQKAHGLEETGKVTNVEWMALSGS